MIPDTTLRFSILKLLQVIFFGSIILYFGKMLFIPLFFGLLVGLVMYPICKWLENRSLPRSLAVSLCLIVVTILIAGLVALLFWQINVLKDDAPIIAQKIKGEFSNLQQWLTATLGITLSKGANWTDELSGNLGNLIGSTLTATIDTLFILFLVPVFTALFLYHRQVFVKYLQSIIGEKYRRQLDDILLETIHTYFNYIKGMIIVYIIVGILNTIGLLLLGIEHALLFGMLCAIMTIIPYIGIIVSALLPISIAWMTTNSIWYPLGVVAVFAFVQYLEANVIFPKVVGTQLNVSTWATLVAILAGGVLWGVSGMILFIPFVAILKIISDNVEEWSSLNLLLSRNIQKKSKGHGK